MAERTRPLVLATLLAAAVVGAIILSARGPAAREIHLVARNTTFYLAGGSEPNPTLHVRPGETVRIVLRNSDAGMRHDFTIPDWRVETEAIAGTGQTAITFQAPERGRVEYRCTPHATVMKGTISVE